MESGAGSARRFVGAPLLVLLVAAWSAGCAARSGSNDFPELGQYAGREIDRVDFRNAEPFGADTLRQVIRTQPSRCTLLGLPICIPFTNIGQDEHELDPRTVTSDVQRLELFYRSAGFFGTDVTPEVVPSAEDVTVTFVIARGDSIIMDSLAVVGTEGVLDPDSLRATLDLQAGELFDLRAFAASADTVLFALRERGHASATVLRNFTVDTLRDRASITLEAIPGPRVTVDSIVIAGTENLGRADVLRQLTFRKGALLLATELVESQRNLYMLDLVQFASVAIAPDSLQAFPGDSARSTVLVTIAEAPVYEVNAALGFGSIECFRSEVSWENRSFAGGARRLTLTGSVSKIGTGTGLRTSLCRGFASDTLAQSLDYSLGAAFVQPFFISPRNNIQVNLFTDAQSEPQVFRRTATGGRLALGRRLAARTALSAGFDIEHGHTVANPALYCAAFLVCQPDDIEELSSPRFRNSISASALHDDTDLAIDPTHGTITRAALAWAPPWLLSDVTFVRMNAGATIYRTLRPGWIGAASLQLGTFFRTAGTSDEDNFLPPEERFYAGGATTVRGYDRNSLGPGVWVAPPTRDGEATIRDDVGVPRPDTAAAEFVPTGGTALIIANVEVRMPSPFLGDIMRMAAFVDAGSVGQGNLWDSETMQLRVTPGLGVRMQTPVGPVRLDIGYNPHRRTAGPLLVRDDEAGTLVRVRDVFQPDRRSFLSRIRIHLGVGQAF
jgi:outer membrane protein assembly complex protein YaeT